MKAVRQRLLILGGFQVGAEMAQAVRRLGGEVARVEGAEHVLARDPAPLGRAWVRCSAATGSTWASACVRPARGATVTTFPASSTTAAELRGDHLLVATGRRPHTAGLGLETIGITAMSRGIPVDGQLRAAEHVWAIGDATGIRLLTHVGEYQGEVVAEHSWASPREANYEAVPDVVYTDPQAAAADAEARFRATARGLEEVAETATLPPLRAVQRLPDPAQRRWPAEPAPALGPGGRGDRRRPPWPSAPRVPLLVLRDPIQPLPNIVQDVRLQDAQGPLHPDNGGFQAGRPGRGMRCTALLG